MLPWHPHDFENSDRRYNTTYIDGNVYRNNTLLGRFFCANTSKHLTASCGRKEDKLNISREDLKVEKDSSERPSYLLKNPFTSLNSSVIVLSVCFRVNGLETHNLVPLFSGTFSRCS